MSMTKYRQALNNAWQEANRPMNIEYKAPLVEMWLSIAAMELREVVKPDRMDLFSWSPPAETDPGVVGVRCENCRHFIDNHHEEYGCRECGCELTTVVAR